MTVLLSLILPVLAGGGVVALCWLLPPLRKWTWLSGAAFGVALAVGVLASFVSDTGLPSFPPAKRWEWLGIMTMVAGLLALVLPITGQPGQQRSWPLLELVAVFVGGIVAKFPLLAAWAGGKPVSSRRPRFCVLSRNSPILSRPEAASKNASFRALRELTRGEGCPNVRIAIIYRGYEL